MPGTENLGSTQGPVRSWTLTKSLLLPSLCWTSVLPSCILKLTLIPTGKCSYHPSSKKALLTATGDITENRNWMDTMQGSTASKDTHSRVLNGRGLNESYSQAYDKLIAPFCAALLFFLIYSFENYIFIPIPHQQSH